ncbi:DUF4426 domain-containing protein [Agaribacterium sp. ZY112]|uniref:DUF4426 domain-containing protein n=1 Tax=Agaribacterium sp. ZY112 TaxID=3233574 RepID=UPI00352517B6
MLRILFTLLTLCVLALTSQAEAPNNQSDFLNYTVQHTVFNSTFVPAEIAKIYKLKRSAYESLINVSVYSNEKPMQTIAADISGSVRNLMQQKTKLKFIEIKEQNAVYYLAPVRINGEETLHFELEVKPSSTDTELKINFDQKVYSD